MARISEDRAVGAMLGLATAAAQIGLAAIIGAFLAGMVVAINATWLVAAAWVAPALRDPVRSRRANIGLAAALVVSTGAAVVH